MILNGALLAAQAAVLGFLALRELSRDRNGNPISLILCVALLLLIHAQAWHVLGDLRGVDQAFYFKNEISKDGFGLANLCLAVSVLIMALLIARKPLEAASRAPIPPRDSYAPSALGYAAVALIVLGAAYLMADLLGGLSNIPYVLGTMVGGQTVLLILISLGKMPALHKLAAGRRLNALDAGLLGLTLLLTLVNSRGQTLIIAAQLLIIYRYAYGGKRLPRRELFLAAGAALFIMIGYGSIRDYVSKYHAYHWEGLQAYYLGTGTSQGFNPFDFFFRFNIGTFTGFAGILSFWNQQGINYDLGASNGLLLTHLVPNALRSSFLADTEAWLSAIYPYDGSVVPGGYEAWFAHFGFPGIALFSFILGSWPGWFHRRLTAPAADRAKYGIFSIYVLNLILGSAWVMLFYALGDLAMLAAYRFIVWLDPARRPGEARAE